MGSIRDVEIIKQFIRLCDEGVAQGWHERNGGNLSYRMRREEVEECRPYFTENPGDWVSLGIQADNLKGEYFIVTGSGKYLKNVGLEPQNNICILETNGAGDGYRIVWGLEAGGKPTSELPTHFMNHSVRKRVTKGRNRVIYHAHTPYVAAMTHVLPHTPEAFTKVLWKSETECCMFFPGGLGVVPWMVPGGMEIARATCAQMEKYDAVVWAFHGMFAAGDDFDSALGLLQVIEKACQIASVVYSMTSKAPGSGDMQAITDDNLRQLGRELGLALNEDVLRCRIDGE